ncbi:hypothetical protein GW17_00056106 [Ensete ventricosum]|nr:hypothetical protein GW17_00056106 [Ensete ventricosum]
MFFNYKLQARDFDPDSLRRQLPKAVSSLEWAISEGKGRVVYVHCTAGLGRAPAVAIAYLFWFCDMDVSLALTLLLQDTQLVNYAFFALFSDIIILQQFYLEQLNTAYITVTSKRPCAPNKRGIRGATFDLAKNDPWKEPFESLPEHAFGGIADWERKLIQERVRGLRGT